MNRDDINRMAREARLSNGCGKFGYPYLPELERFAELVAEAEREACAKFIEQDYVRQFDEPWRDNLSKAIRARGLTSLQRQLIDAEALQSDPTGLKARGQV